jgi:hypothetical protein
MIQYLLCPREGFGEQHVWNDDSRLECVLTRSIDKACVSRLWVLVVTRVEHPADTPVAISTLTPVGVVHVIAVGGGLAFALPWIRQVCALFVDTLVFGACISIYAIVAHLAAARYDGI